MGNGSMSLGSGQATSTPGMCPDPQLEGCAAVCAVGNIYTYTMCAIYGICRVQLSFKEGIRGV